MHMDYAGSIEKPIGIFDSGVGGLSVLRAIRTQLPFEDIIYFGDQEKVPYGSRSLLEVRQLSDGVVRFLLDEGVKLIVVACNTASAAALHYLRETFPFVPFVGMEPAVKPAAENTHTGKVGVLATPATFQGELYASVVERFAQEVVIFQETCPGLVGQIEAGKLNSQEVRNVLEDALKPMVKQGIDTVVLGCTHYPFVIPMIAQIVGPNVRVIDPAPAIARQTMHLLERDQIAKPGPQLSRLTFFTSAAPADLQALLPKLLGETGSVFGLKWIGNRLVRA